jgi:hypothetical protein
MALASITTRTEYCAANVEARQRAHEAREVEGWAAAHNLSSNTFGMLLILTIISYLAGHFALRFEILRNARIRALNA